MAMRGAVRSTAFLIMGSACAVLAAHVTSLDDSIAVVSDSYIVQFSDAASYASHKTGGNIDALNYGCDHQQLFVASGKLTAAELAEVETWDGVLTITPDILNTISDDVASAGVQLNPTSWGLDRINQRDLPLDDLYDWDNDGSGVNIIVIDSGIATDHPFFEGRATFGADCALSQYPCVTNASRGDPVGHGTHVAGTTGSSVYGVAKGVDIIDIRACDDDTCTSSAIIASFLHAIEIADSRPDERFVINFSIRGPITNITDVTVEAAWNKGIVVVVAAGNDIDDACNYSPGHTKIPIVVGSTNITDFRSVFSNYGECVDIYAPGTDIVSTYYLWESGFLASSRSGTSMASPHVAGAAARILAGDMSLTPDEVKAQLVASATVDVIPGDSFDSTQILLYTGQASTALPTSASTAVPTTPTISAVPTTAATSATTSTAPTTTRRWTGRGTAPPTPYPTSMPTPAPTSAATPVATPAPTSGPTSMPTAVPTGQPSMSPPTPAPTSSPTPSPTTVPTSESTNVPTSVLTTPASTPTPTASPTSAPSSAPIPAPTDVPTPAAGETNEAATSSSNDDAVILDANEGQGPSSAMFVGIGLGCLLCCFICGLFACRRSREERKESSPDQRRSASAPGSVEMHRSFSSNAVQSRWNVNAVDSGSVSTASTSDLGAYTDADCASGGRPGASFSHVTASASFTNTNSTESAETFELALADVTPPKNGLFLPQAPLSPPVASSVQIASKDTFPANVGSHVCIDFGSSAKELEQLNARDSNATKFTLPGSRTEESDFDGSDISTVGSLSSSDAYTMSHDTFANPEHGIAI